MTGFWGFASRKRTALRAFNWRRAIACLFAFTIFQALAIFRAPAVDADTFSPVVSYQFLDSLSTPDTPTTITSPVVSYQYYDWIGDSNVTFTNSPNVSYYFNGSPRILTQPLARVLKAGQTATFSVSADGSPPLTYHWRLNGVTLPNSNGASIAIDNLLLNDSGAYSVVVQNAYGSVVSNDARLTVYLGPVAPKPNLPTQTTATQSPSTAQKTKPPPPVSTQLRWFNAVTNLFENVPQPIPAGKMAIVLTHGWKSNPYGTASNPNWPIKMARALAPSYAAKANIFAWDWQTDAGKDDFTLVAARTVPQGMALGIALADTLGPTYDKNIHFIGHSFGTAVSCAAANYVHGDKRPRGDARPATEKYASYNTHMTLFDEAELATGFKGGIAK